MDTQFLLSHIHEILTFLAVFTVVSLIVFLIPYWFIFKKAGFSPWISLLLLIPVVNLIVLYVVAFSKWDVIPADSVTPTTVIRPAD